MRVCNFIFISTVVVMVDCFDKSSTTYLFLLLTTIQEWRCKTNSSNLDPIEEDGDDGTWIDRIYSMLL